MQMEFDVNEAIREWRQKLSRQQGMEPGYIEELESSLRDRYDVYLLSGMKRRAAFAKAVEKTWPVVDSSDEEYRKVTGLKKPDRNPLSCTFGYLLPNYLTVALRNLRRQKFYSSVNFISLVVGMLCTGMAGLYIQYESSFDEFHEDGDRIYRIGRHFRSQDYSVVSFDGYFNTPPEEQMKQINAIGNVKGVADACQFQTFWQSFYVQNEEKKLPVKDILQTNTPQSFFDFFDWQFLTGSAKLFASQLNTVVLTEPEAEKLYGTDWQEQDLLAEQLLIDSTNYQVAGVIADIPKNSHYDFTLAIHAKKISYWGSRTYVKLAPGANPDQVRKNMDANMDKINTRLATSELFGGTIIQPLTSIHLHSDMLYELKPPGDLRYLYIFGIVGLIILLITISNYTNLSIAMNAGRAREIGMRKVFGAGRSDITGQFLLEAVLLALLAALPVMAGLHLLIPLFNNFMGTGIPEEVFTNPFYWIAVPLTAMLIGLLAGIYPALFLAGKKISGLFKGNAVKTNRSGANTRKALIAFQFTLLIGLCSFTIFVNQQLQFIQNKDLGYDEDGVLYVNLSSYAQDFTTFKQLVMEIPGVDNVGSGSPLGRSPFNQVTYKLGQTDEVFDDAYNIALSYSALDLLDIETSIPEWVENPEQAPQKLVLINETAVKKLTNRFNITREELLKRRIITEPEATQDDGTVGFPFEIGGTFEDINMFSLKEKITPYFLDVYRKDDFVRWASIGFSGTPPNELLERVKEKYLSMNHRQTFIHSFLTDNVKELYKKERKIGQLTVYLSIVAFLVALIGLIALTAFLTTLKQKEIGIRKILGASSWELVRLFNKEYLILLLLSLAIATPLAYWGVGSWLQSFAYRIDIHWLVFVLAALITFFTSVLAVSSITLKVAQADPVQALQENQ